MKLAQENFRLKPCILSAVVEGELGGRLVSRMDSKCVKVPIRSGVARSLSQVARDLVFCRNTPLTLNDNAYN